MTNRPNTITLTGFGFVIINFLTLLWYTPGLDTTCPPWVYASWSLGLFLYQTFDAIDGTQARRTGQSGPLGELFDHGVDALNTSIEVLLFSAAMEMGQGWKTIIVLGASLLTFYVQTWEEYHTHSLILGVVSGPVEGILTLVVVYALTAVLPGGGSFWQQSMLHSLGFDGKGALYEMAWNEWYMVYGGIVLVFNTLTSISNVFAARRERKEDPTEALLGLLPFAVAWTVIPIYLTLNPIVLHQHLVPFVFLVGIMNAYSVGQMIVRHLTKSPFPYLNVLILPIALGALDSAGPWLQEHFGIGWPSALGAGQYQIAYVFLCLGLAVGVYGSFVHDVITTICDYLDIWCLRIKSRHVQKVQDERSAQVESKKAL